MKVKHAKVCLRRLRREKKEKCTCRVENCMRKGTITLLYIFPSQKLHRGFLGLHLQHRMLYSGHPSPLLKDRKRKVRGAATLYSILFMGSSLGFNAIMKILPGHPGLPDTFSLCLTASTCLFRLPYGTHCCSTEPYVLYHVLIP